MDPRLGAVINEAVGGVIAAINGARGEIRDLIRGTALHDAAKEGREDEVEALLLSGAEVNKQDLHGVTPLWLACTKCSSPRIIDRLLSAGADAKAKDRYGWSPAHQLLRGVAVHHELYQDFTPPPADMVVQILLSLLEHGASLDARDNIGATPFFYVRDPVVAGFILEQNLSAAPLAELKDWTLASPLHHARNPTMAALFIERGLDAWYRNRNGQLPIHQAARKGRHEVVTFYLQRHDAMMDEKDGAGWTTLHHACGGSESRLKGRQKAAVALVERGARLPSSSAAEPVPVGFTVAATLNAALQQLLSPLITDLFRSTSRIPPNRRTLRWALTDADLSDMPEGSGGLLQAQGATNDELVRFTEKRLKPLKNDAWHRRRALVMAYAARRQYFRDRAAEADRAAAAAAAASAGTAAAPDAAATVPNASAAPAAALLPAFVAAPVAAPAAGAGSVVAVAAAGAGSAVPTLPALPWDGGDGWGDGGYDEDAGDSAQWEGYDSC